MYGVLLFFHLSGLFVWLGSLFAIVVMLLLLKNQLDSPQTKKLINRIVRVFSMFAHPSSLVVLISGVIMIIQIGLGNNKPFWLDIMEKGGGTIILLALVLTGIMGSRMKKRLAGAQPGDVINLSGYLSVMIAFIVSILAIVLIVSMKLN